MEALIVWVFWILIIKNEFFQLLHEPANIQRWGGQPFPAEAIAQMIFATTKEFHKPKPNLLPNSPPKCSYYFLVQMGNQPREIYQSLFLFFLPLIHTSILSKEFSICMNKIYYFS